VLENLTSINNEISKLVMQFSGMDRRKYKYAGMYHDNSNSGMDQRKFKYAGMYHDNLISGMTERSLEYVGMHQDYRRDGVSESAKTSRKAGLEPFRFEKISSCLAQNATVRKVCSQIILDFKFRDKKVGNQTKQTVITHFFINHSLITTHIRTQVTSGWSNAVDRREISLWDA
jgi:hypothetical protein